jgi:hypothetical protein
MPEYVRYVAIIPLDPVKQYTDEEVSELTTGPNAPFPREFEIVLVPSGVPKRVT